MRLQFRSWKTVGAVLSRILPQTETLILAIGFLCTIWGKILVARPLVSPGDFVALGRMLLPDVLFFTGVWALIRHGVEALSAAVGPDRRGARNGRIPDCGF